MASSRFRAPPCARLSMWWDASATGWRVSSIQGRRTRGLFRARSRLPGRSFPVVRAVGPRSAEVDQLDPVGRSLEAERPVATDEGGNVLGPDHALVVRRLLPQHGGRDAEQYPELRLHGEARGPRLELSELQFLLACRLQLELDHAGGRGERDVVHGLRAPGREILQNHDGHPIIDVGGEVENAARRLLAALLHRLDLVAALAV